MLGTQYPVLDELTGGLMPGELFVVASRPRMGKTTFLANLAEHLAMVKEVPVAFFSLQIPRKELLERMLCCRLNVDYRMLRRRMLHGPPRHGF